jgi:TIR domain
MYDREFVCFVSYAEADAANQQAAMADFCTLLDQQIAEKALPFNSSFVSTYDMRTGDWEKHLTRNLNASVCFVALYSPTYFQRDWCKKEWAHFFESAQIGEHPHENMFPVPWITYSDAVRSEPAQYFPPNAGANERSIQFFRLGNQQQIKPILDFGLRHAISSRQQQPQFATAVTEYMRALGEQITSVTRRFMATAQSSQKEPLPGQPNKIFSRDSTKSSFRKTRVYVIAGHPNEYIGTGCDPAPYELEGGPDWKPYFPVQRSVQELVGASIRDMEELKRLTRDLEEVVQSAWNDNRYAVVIVDPWTVHKLEAYKKLIGNFATRRYINCFVFILWNRSDAKLVEAEAQIRESYRNSFFELHFDSTHYFENVLSEDEFRKKLKRALAELQSAMQLRFRVGDPPRAVDTNGPRLPVIGA